MEAIPNGDEVYDPRAIFKVVRDPIHGYVHLPRELAELVGHPLLQRLKRVSQTAMAHTVYPSMTGTRYEHALGSMHLAGHAWGYLWRNSAGKHTQFREAARTGLLSGGGDLDPVTQAWIASEAFHADFDRVIGLAVRTAALLHDIGHPPFSHTLEPFYYRHLRSIVSDVTGFKSNHWDKQPAGLRRKAFHERAGEAMISSFLEPSAANLPWSLVRAVAYPKLNGSWAHALHDLVSGEVDIDRLDYLLRDTSKSATEFGALDSQRLIQALELHVDSAGWHVGFGVRATSAIESFLLQRLQYYRWVIYHPTVIGLNHMLVHALEKMVAFQTPARQGIQTTPPLLERLNYFASTRAPADEVTKQLAEVDDGTVLEMLKSESHRIRESRARGVNLTPREQTFLALTEAVIHGASNWISLWKTQAEYESFGSLILPEVYQSVTERGADLADSIGGEYHQDIIAKVRRQIAALQATRTRLSAYEHFVEQSDDDDSLNFGVGMNDLTALLFEAGSGEQALGLSLAKKEASFAAMFLESCPPELKDQPGAAWVVSYDEVVTNVTDEFATRVYSGEKFVKITRISPLVTSLQYVERRRPHFHCFYICLGKSREEISEMIVGNWNEVSEAFARSSAYLAGEVAESER